MKKDYIVELSEEEADELMDEHWVGELVLCKDCKYWDAEEHNCNIKIGWFACGADWFCADGERREAE